MISEKKKKTTLIFLWYQYKSYNICSALNENIAKNVLESQVEDMSFDGVNDDTLNCYYQQCQMMTDKVLYTQLVVYPET